MCITSYIYSKFKGSTFKYFLKQNTPCSLTTCQPKQVPNLSFDLVLVQFGKIIQLFYKTPYQNKLPRLLSSVWFGNLFSLAKSSSLLQNAIPKQVTKSFFFKVQFELVTCSVWQNHPYLLHYCKLKTSDQNLYPSFG